MLKILNHLNAEWQKLLLACRKDLAAQDLAVHDYLKSSCPFVIDGSKLDPDNAAGRQKMVVAQLPFYGQHLAFFFNILYIFLSLAISYLNTV